MPPKLYCISWQELTRVSQRFTNNRTFSNNYCCFSGIPFQRNNLISFHAPKINRSTYFLTSSVFAIKDVHKMPHALDIYHSQWVSAYFDFLMKKIINFTIVILEKLKKIKRKKEFRNKQNKSLFKFEYLL